MKLNTLISEDCGSYCKEIFEYDLNFIIVSMDLPYEDLENLLILLSFDGNVLKISLDEDTEFPIGGKISFLTSPEDLCEKLKTSPIKLFISEDGRKLGSTTHDLTDCFREAVKCPKFSSQKMTKVHKFLQDGEEVGALSFCFHVEKVSEDRSPFSAQEDENDHEYEDHQDGVDKNQRKLDDIAEIELQLKPFIEEYERDLNITDLLEACDIDDVVSEITRKPQSAKIPDEKNLIAKPRFDVSSDRFDSEESRHEAKNSPLHKLVAKESLEDEIFKERAERKQRIFAELKSQAAAASGDSIDWKIHSDISSMKVCSNCSSRLDLKNPLTSCEYCIDKQNENDSIGSISGSLTSTSEASRIAEIELRKNRSLKKLRNRRLEKNQRERRSIQFRCRYPRCNKVHQLRLEALQRKQSTATYPYQFCNKNAGILLGHRLCTLSVGLVPKNMGWLWNLNTEKGWCPGAVRRSVGKIMKQYLYPKMYIGDGPKIAEEKPTLRINKKDGDYQITLEDQGNDPIVFQIKKDLKMKEVKNVLKSKGIAKSCKCADLKKCRCLNTKEKLRVMSELRGISKKFGLKSKLSYSDLRESSESEVNFEFTPESIANKSGRMKKVPQSLTGTQYDQNDINRQALKTDKHGRVYIQTDYSKGSYSMSENGNGHESDNYEDSDDNDNFYGLECDEDDERKSRRYKTIKHTPKIDKSVKTVSQAKTVRKNTSKENLRNLKFAEDDPKNILRNHLPGNLRDTPNKLISNGEVRNIQFMRSSNNSKNLPVDQINTGNIPRKYSKKTNEKSSKKMKGRFDKTSNVGFLKDFSVKKKHDLKKSRKTCYRMKCVPLEDLCSQNHQCSYQMKCVPLKCQDCTSAVNMRSVCQTYTPIRDLAYYNCV